MKAYLTSIMAISIVSALVSLLVPDKRAAKKYLKFTVGIISLLVISEPLCNLSMTSENIDFDFANDFPTETSETYLDAIIKNAEIAIESELCLELYENFKLSEEYAGVEVRLDTSDISDITISEITVTLKSYGSWRNSAAITDFFSKKYSCEVKIAYE